MPSPAPSGEAWASAVPTPTVTACQSAPAAPAFHRLSRTEYHNSVNQLLGTRLPLRERLPADPLVYGFDNNGDLAVSAPLVQRYLDVAELAVSQALADPGTRAALVPCALDKDHGCARQVLSSFLPRAFRRPITSAELEEHLGYVEVCNESRLAGVGCALQAALVDPAFLFRTELLSANAGTCSAQAPLAGEATITQAALAARLSFFLTASAPDQRLLDLAHYQKLDDPAVIEAEVNRLLDSAEQSRFTRPLRESLPVHWLGLDSLEAAAPSPALHPAFDEEVRSAMAAESRLFFAEILRQNRSALELLRADFTFANERLAAHYALPGVRGSEMRLVDTTGTIRGGVLGQASLLTITSSSENTSIALRGRWVLQNLLCTPMSDPPAGAEEMIPAPDPALGLTRRQSLQQRTGGPPCSGCHNLINPLGFGLEIFDATGAERSRDAHGRPIDASGVLPSGQRFETTAELLALLQKDPRFPRCLTEKMLVAALGRQLNGECDKQVLQTLSDELVRDGFRLKNHVVRIAASQLFRLAHRPQPEAP